MTLDELKNIFNIENRTKYFLHTIILFLIVSLAAFALLIAGDNSLEGKRPAAAKKRTSAFDGLNLEAKAIFVYDAVNRRELFSVNPNVPMPLASLTKVMTAVTLSGKLPDDQKVKITKEDLTPEGDSKLLVGDFWKVKDLRDFTLLTSSNDGALALAAACLPQALGNEAPSGNNSKNPEQQFADEMNKKASEIGLTNSRFFNEHGLDEPARTTDGVQSGGNTYKGGAYGSAKDMATLFSYILKNHPEILEATRYKNLEFASDSKKYLAENTNEIVNKIPNLLASKTGYTALAGGNLVVAFDAGLGRPIVISVLGSSEQGRFSDVLQLVNASLKYIQENLEITSSHGTNEEN